MPCRSFCDFGDLDGGKIAPTMPGVAQEQELQKNSLAAVIVVIGIVLLRCPSCMGREKTVNKADLVSDQKTEAETEQTRSQCQSMGKLLTTLSHHRERGGHTHCDQHHARNGAHAKDQQVNDRPMEVSDCGQDQQSHSRGTGKSVHDAHHERPKILIQADLSKHAVQPGQRR
jgi:hypothetical protein